MRPLLLLAVLLSLGPGVVPASAQVYRFRTYTSNSGLPSNATYAVFQDRKGYMWFATDGGACRFDGVSYITYGIPQGLPDAGVRGFVEDAAGNLWVLTRGGLSRFDGVRFTTFTTADGLPADELRSALRARDGTVWFGTTLGLARWDGTRFEAWDATRGVPAAPVWTIHEDSGGRMWVGTRGAGLARRDGDRFHAFGTADGLPTLNVFDLADDGSGGLWIATDGGLAHYDGKAFRTYTTADGLGSNQVSSVLLDRHGRVWCGTFGGGISRLENGRFTVFDRRNGVPDDFVTTIFKDAENDIWFGSLWNGAFRFVSERFATFTGSSGLPEGLVSGIAEGPDGLLWFASINEGIASMDRKGRVRRYRKTDGLLDDRTWALHVDRRGRVWAGSLAGVSVLDQGRFRTYAASVMGATDRISSIVEDREGVLWFGSGAARSNGVIAFDGERFVTHGTAEGLAHAQVNSFAIDAQGILWACTEAGLSRWDGSRFTTYSRAHGLPGKRVLAAYADESGRFWVATPAGLAQREGERFRSWRSTDGLVNDYVTALTSGAGRLWAGTSRGISAFDGQTFVNFTTRQGLVSHEISTATGLRQSDGSVWFGTSTGAMRYQPVKEMTLPIPPQVHLRAVRARAGTLDPAPALTLAHHEDDLTFDFQGLSFADEEAVRYSYLLEGLDSGWSEPDESRSVRFTNLQPGRYMFMVKARSAGGQWSTPSTLAIELRPAFWQTRSFQGLALLLAVAVGYAGYTRRVQSMLARERERIEGFRQLLDAVRVINSGLDLTTVLQNIADEAAQLVGGEPRGIGLVRDGTVVFERVWSDGRWQTVDRVVALGEGTSGRVAAGGALEILPDDDDGTTPGVVAVPIVNRAGAVVGVLEVQHRIGSPPFGEDAGQLLQSLSHQAAIAIENAHLFGDLEEKKVMLSESLWAVEQLYKNERDTTRILHEVNDMKTSFMIVTSHEMRTPLTILKGHIEALQGGYLGTLTSSQQATLAICLRNVDRMISSFNEIIEMLKIDQRAPLRPQPLDLEDEVEQALAECRSFVEQRGQALTVEVLPDLPLVVADSEKVQMVLANLVQNAIKFTPDGGQIQVRLVPLQDAVQVTVSDNGIGIAPDELDRVFDRFYTSRDSLHHGSGTYKFQARGAGLGLAIAKGYVEAHGGRIWCESAGAGQGSRFHVVLPESPAGAEESWRAVEATPVES